MKNLGNLMRRHQTWTAEQLVELSESLGFAYCPGLNQNHNRHGRNQGWDTQKLIKLSESLGHAHHLGL